MGNQSIESGLRVLKMIVLAMIGWLVVYAGVAWFLVSGGVGVDPEMAEILYPALGGVLLISLVGGFVLRRVLVGKLLAKARGSNREQRMTAAWPVYRLWTIIGAALAEAPALFGVVTYQLTGSPLGLLVSALGVIRLVLLLPSEAALEGLADAIRG